MRRLILVLFAIGVASPPAFAENIHETVRRIDEKLHELETIGAGERGPAGVQGSAGPRGPQGAMGPRGPAGSRGATGPRGLRGVAGPRGPAGQRGPRGFAGAQGQAGTRGPAGPRGPKGAPGKDATLEGLSHLSIGQQALHFGVNNGDGQIRVNNSSGEARIHLGMDGNDNAHVLLHDGDGTNRVYLGGGGFPSVSLFNAPNKLGAFIGVWNNWGTGGAFFADKDGKRRVELGVNKGGDGYLTVNGKSVNDYAEILELATREGIRPGSVVAYDTEAGGIVPASVANARRVVGVISGAGGFRPGMVIGSRSDESRDFPVSLSGVVYVWVSSEAGEIVPGDLLVASSVAGVGMRAVDPNAVPGMVFGKALEPWSGTGEGLVLMLVMHR